MHHALIQDGVVRHVWHGPVPEGIPNVHPIAPGSAHVGDKWENGQAVAAEQTVTSGEVNAECERRILELFPITRQLNIIDEGSPSEVQDMKDRRNALRACARALNSMAPVPSNYRDDRFWVGSTFQGYLDQIKQSHMQANGMPQQMLGYGQGFQAGVHPMTNQPIIMMQAPSQPAPIIIQGAQPGTMVIQGPAQVQQQPQIMPQVQVVHSSSPQQAPLPPPMAGLPAPSQANATPQQADISEEMLFETAARALMGHEWSVSKMTPIAERNGMSMTDYCSALMKRRHDKFERVLDTMAAKA